MMHRKSYGFFAQNLFIKFWSKQFSYWKKINRETLASIAMIQLAKKQNKKTPVKHTHFKLVWVLVHRTRISALLLVTKFRSMRILKQACFVVKVGLFFLKLNIETFSVIILAAGLIFYSMLHLKIKIFIAILYLC